MGSLGYEVDQQDDTQLTFARGDVAGDFSVELAQTKIVFALPFSEVQPVLIKYGFFAAFDTGDLWRLAKQVEEVLARE